MNLFLVDLFSRIGEERAFDLSYGCSELDGHHVSDASIDRFSILADPDKTLKILAEGQVILLIPCDRCLKETPVTVRFSESWVLDPKRHEDMDHDPVYCFTDSSLDTDELLSEMIRPNLPQKVLCSTDCKGICPNCGANLNETECGCSRHAGSLRINEALEKALKCSDQFRID